MLNKYEYIEWETEESSVSYKYHVRDAVLGINNCQLNKTTPNLPFKFSL